MCCTGKRLFKCKLIARSTRTVAIEQFRFPKWSATTKLANNFTLDQVLCISWRCYKRHLLKSIEKCKISLIYQQMIAFILNHLETRPKQMTNDIKWKFETLTTPCTYKSKEEFLPDERKIISRLINFMGFDGQVKTYLLTYAIVLNMWLGRI